jgi:hypothetical protein
MLLRLTEEPENGVGRNTGLFLRALVLLITSGMVGD